MRPNFSAYPWDRLPRLSRDEARKQSSIARWIGGVGRARALRLEKLVGASEIEIEARIAKLSTSSDPFAAVCTVRIGGASIEVSGSSAGVRAIAQRLLGGPAELPAPRPLGVVEQAIWCLVVATALEDLGVGGQVWPSVGTSSSASTTTSTPSAGPSHARAVQAVQIDARLGGIDLVVEVWGEPGLDDVVPPRAGDAPWPAWIDTFVLSVPLVLGRCSLHRDELPRLAPRSLVTLEPPTTDSQRGGFRLASELALDLDVLDGAIGLRGKTGDLVATVATGYVPRDMALPDDARVELTVALGTTQLSLHQVLELAVGQVLPLGRPLAGPFEVRAQGRVLGRGELVDVDGELAVRIVSLGD